MLNRHPLTRRKRDRQPVEAASAVFEVLEPRLLLAASAGPAYEVWGGATDHLGDQDFYLNIGQQDYDYLGGADATASFDGQYPYYVIAANWPVAIDAVEWAGYTLSEGWDGFNLRDGQNIEGYPDGISAILGPAGYPAKYRGYIAIDNYGLMWQGLTVHTTPLPEGPLEVYVEREVAWYDGNNVEYFLNTEVGGVGLIGMQVTMPWDEQFNTEDYLPVDWAGEPFEYGDGVFAFAAYTEGPEQFFEVDWLLDDTQWADIESLGPWVSVVYGESTWGSSADFLLAPLPEQVPNFTWPRDGQTDVPLNLTATWDPWMQLPAEVPAAPPDLRAGLPSGSAISFSLSEAALWDLDSPVADAWLPPEATTYTVPEQLFGETDYVAEVEFMNLDSSQVAGAEMSVRSTVESEILFTTETDMPDLVVSDAWLSESLVAAGRQVDLNYRVENWTNWPADPFDAALFVSDYFFVDDTDPIDQLAALPALPGGGVIDETFTITAPQIPATYYYAIMADYVQAIYEYDEMNNWSPVVELVVADFDAFEPDDTADQAGQIAVDGEPQTHSIGHPQDVDWVTFTLEGASNVQILTDGAIPYGDTEIWLYHESDLINEIAYDDDGNWESEGRQFSAINIESLAPGGYYVRIASYDQYDSIAEYTVSVLAGPIATPLIEGHVYDYQTGSALAGIQVQVFQGQEPDFAGQHAWDYLQTVTTDADGLYQVFDLPDRQYRLNVYEGQSVEYHYIGGDLFNVAVGQDTTTTGADFHLRHAGSLVGYVYDSAGYPLQGIEVIVEAGYVHDEWATDWHSTFTEQDGSYEIFLLETQEEIYPVKIGWSADYSGRPYAQQIAPDLYAAADLGTPGADFYLDTGGWIEGRVETTTGQPVANHWDVLEPATMIANGLLEDPNVSTDQYGEFRIPVPAGIEVYFLTSGWSWERYELAGVHYAWGERWLGPYTVEAGGTTDMGTLVVPEAVSLSGTITDPLGNPIVGAEIGIFGYDVFGGEIWLDDGDAGYSDQLGQYSAEAVPAGTFTIGAWADGFLAYNSDVVSAESFGQNVVHDIIMTPTDQGATVTGSIANYDQIVDKAASGAPLPWGTMDYEEYLRTEEIGVISYDSSVPWTILDMLFPDRRFTGGEDAEDGYDDYFIPNSSAGTYLINVPSGTEALFAYRNGLTANGSWYANLSDPVLLSLASGDSLTGQDITIPIGANSVAGTVLFPSGHPGNLSESSASIFIREVGVAGGHLGRAVISVSPADDYAAPDLPDGNYYIYAVADGLAPFVSQPFALAGGQRASVDIVFEYPADLAFNPPAETHVQAETGSLLPLPWELVNLGAADPGQVTIALYASSDAAVDRTDVPLVVMPPGQQYPDSWSFRAPGEPGTYYIAALADPDNAVFESDETNNWSGVVTLDLINPADLAFSLPDQTHLQAETGSLLPLPWRLVNLGVADPGQVTIALYASSDPVVDPTDMPLTVFGPGEGYPDSWSFRAPGEPGTYYIAALADPANEVSEFDETNNWSEVVTLEIVSPADLAFNPPDQRQIQSEIGSLLPLPWELVNLGQADPGQVTIALYASSDAVVDQTDTPLTVFGPGEGYPDSWSFQAPGEPGTYYVAALADADNAVSESDETNNWSAVVTLELTDPRDIAAPFADFFPLVAGQVRRYMFTQTEPDGRTKTSMARSVYAMAVVNQQEVCEVRRYHDGRHISSTYYSMSDQALRLHGQRYMAGGIWRVIDFDPAFNMCPNDLSIGMTFESTGSWCGVSGGGVGWSGSYQQLLTVERFQELTTPVGTFNALQMRFEVTADKSGEGLDMVINDDYRAWLVEGFGIVREAGVWSETVGGTESVWNFEYVLTTRAPDVIVGDEPTVDLTARFDDRFAPPSQLTPGRRIAVPVIVQNQGLDPVKGEIAVELYASKDPLLSEGDARIAWKENVRISLTPGGSQVVKMTLVVPDGVGVGQYFLLAQVDADDVIPEILEDNNVAVSGFASQYVYRFGNIGERRSVSLAMYDQLGVPVTFSLRGNGYGEVTRNADGSLDVSYYETDARSTATIRSPRGTNGVINNVSVLVTYPAEAPAGGSLRTLNAKNIDLTGNVLVEGYLGSMRFDDVAAISGLDEYDHSITIGPAPSAGSMVRLTFGSVGETSMFSQTPVSRLTASEWVDNNETPDQIVCPVLDNLSIRGDRKRQIIGHFGADLILDRFEAAIGDMRSQLLSGAFLAVSRDDMRRINWQGPTLGTAKICGDLYGAAWGIGGDIGKLTVIGRIENSQVRSTGSMGRITMGAAINTDFLAGVAYGVTGRATKSEDIVNPDAKIKSLAVKGRALPGTGEAPFFQNSNFSAGGIGRVSLVNAIADNGGEKFGFYAGTIASISHRDSQTGQSWTWRKQDDGVLSVLDFTADAFDTPDPILPA